MAADPPPLRFVGHSRRESVLRNTMLAFAAQVVTAGFTAGLTLYLTRQLRPHGYGEFSLVVSVVGVLLVVADLGIAPAVARFLAETRTDRRGGSLYLGNALALKGAVTLVASAALFALAGPIAVAYGSPQLVWPFRAGALVLLAQSLFTLYSTALVAVGRVDHNLRVYGSESVAETAASVALVALGGGASGAMFGRAAGYAVGALAAGVLTLRIFGRPAVVPHLRGRGRLAQLGRYAGAMFVVNGVWTLLSQIDVILVGAYLGSTQVGIFSAPVRLANVLHYPGLAAQNSVAPRLARGPDSEPDRTAFLLALRYLVLLQAIVAAPVLVWAGPIVDLLLGHRYAGSVGVLRALTPFIFLQALGPLVSVGVNFMGGTRRRLPVATGALVFQVILSVILIPSNGAVGGAIATSAAYAVYLVGHLLICRRMLSLSLRPLALTTLRSGFAAAVAGLILFLAGTRSLSLGGWLGGGAGAVSSYVIVLLATGELKRAELASLWPVLVPRRRHSQS
jgi:O-antigen/teichoic acid export membrane protein